MNNKSTGEKTKMPTNCQKAIQSKLTKGLLDMIILQFLNQQPMHGYQIITRIRKTYGIYFGASTVYPLLSTLEKKGRLKSTWNMDAERPRKIYALTKEGEAVLNFAENSLSMLCKSMMKEDKITVQAQCHKDSAIALPVN